MPLPQYLTSQKNLNSCGNLSHSHSLSFRSLGKIKKDPHGSMTHQGDRIFLHRSHTDSCSGNCIWPAQGSCSLIQTEKVCILVFFWVLILKELMVAIHLPPVIGVVCSQMTTCLGGNSAVSHEGQPWIMPSGLGDLLTSS